MTSEEESGKDGVKFAKILTGGADEAAPTEVKTKAKKETTKKVA